MIASLRGFFRAPLAGFEVDEWENFPNFTLIYSMLSKGKCLKGRSYYLSNYSPALKKGGVYRIWVV